uniref:V-SNARE coiled-coil homology domain-containing protein n=1 Tax=Amazona collaria TaxID=241587 RepID=A0A8B9EYY7_9PSIT
AELQIMAGKSSCLRKNCRMSKFFSQEMHTVVDIMRMNVDKVLERDQMLSELDNRADALQAGASQFETSAAKLKRKYWWKNCKKRSFFPSGRIISILIFL